MKKMQALVLLLVSLLMCYSAGLRAEDTDIYVDSATNNGVPNVLFVIDTGANFSSSAAVPCTAYAGGGAPSLGNTAGGIEQCALVDAISSLKDGSVNIAILVNNNNNFGTDLRTAGAPAYHEPCMGQFGGCVVRKFALMDSAGKASLINFIKSWKDDNSVNTDTSFGVKSGGDRTANTMQEAWAYYNGKIGMSGKNYDTSIVGSGCQKNFIVYIGNSFNNSGGPADGGSESPFNGTNALTSAQVGATSAQKIKISETVSFKPDTCGVSSIVANTTASNWSENWADEWARLMFEQDGGATAAEGKQSITSYTIGLVNDASCKADYPALLTTMAKYGGGQYFKASTAVDLQFALASILNEVQAVNSVFSSASLPVTVNAQGSFLNQIYLGMFRPEATGNPRWLGNLKQFQIIKDASGTLLLGDSAGNPALSSSGTGFISPNAVSYWTKKDISNLPDSTGGFWVNNKIGVLESPFDSPDGEVVEKGGAAQQIRLESLIANFAATAGGSTNPRRLYTYCPSGTGCVAALTDASNALAIENTGIAAGAFGASSTVAIASIVRTGTSALVTTVGNHGFTNGATVTISNVGQPEYNVTQAVTVNSATTFTITGLPDFPTTPSQGTYSIRSVGGSPVPITSVVRGTSTTGGSNSETVTVTTSAPHGFTTASTIAITGANEPLFNRTGLPTAVTSDTFTFPVSIEPVTPAVNTYQAAFSAAANPAKTVTLSRVASGVLGGSTGATAHGFWVGQSITVTGATAYNGTYTVVSVPTAFSFTASGASFGNPASANGSVSVNTAAQTLGGITRAATTSAATAVATGAPSNFFGSVVGGTRTLNITKLSGSGAAESAYVKSNVMITCLNSGCTSFSYPISVTPPDVGTGTMNATLAGATSVAVPAGNITRVGRIATVSGVTADAFVNGQTVIISTSGTALSSESAYVGSWPITCTAPCTSFTFGQVTLTPDTPATGSNMQAFSGSTPPDKDTVIRWLRGEDNVGGEKGPGGTVTVRPSVHGDVLHSRPLVVNYGDSRGIVVFYGSNDGVYRSVNGNQTTTIGTIPAGGELWGLVLPEHYNDINRLRLNSPELKFPTTTLVTAQLKDYFVDGPTGSFQQLKADGTIDKAYLFLTMRRGGRFMYALDVSTPTAPTVLWKIDTATAGFEELGQTWSTPQVAVIESGVGSTPPTPVLIFGAGYDPNEDTEPPGVAGDTMGRGVYIINALTGALIWSATPTCTTSATCLQVPAMKYAVPSDIALVDRNENGFTDKLYFGDVGGNIWRADIGASVTTSYTVTKLAALGCDTGVCAAGTTPRKFFFPPTVLTLKPSGTAGSFDALSIASGDREHPLKNTATGSSYNVNDRFYMIKDTGTSLSTPVTANVTGSTLFNATSVNYDNSGDGFYIGFATGEKGVNAPLADGGFIFFATNKPVESVANSCVGNLGQARAYAVSPFLGTQTSNVLAGGGLAPSAVAGVITLTTTENGVSTSTQERFCIGCGISNPAAGTNGSDPDGTGGNGSGAGTADCTSSLGVCTPTQSVAKKLRRTYWYKK